MPGLKSIRTRHVAAQEVHANSDRIDRWARGNLDTSQGREDEPFVSNAWFSNCFRGFKDRHSIPVFVMSRHSMSYGVTLQSLQAIQGWDVNQVSRKACIKSVSACRHRSLETAWFTVLCSDLQAVCILDLNLRTTAVTERRGLISFLKGG